MRYPAKGCYPATKSYLAYDIQHHRHIITTTIITMTLHTNGLRKYHVTVVLDQAIAINDVIPINIIRALEEMRLACAISLSDSMNDGRNVTALTNPTVQPTA